MNQRRLKLLLAAFVFSATAQELPVGDSEKAAPEFPIEIPEAKKENIVDKAKSTNSTPPKESNSFLLKENDSDSSSLSNQETYSGDSFHEVVNDLRIRIIAEAEYNNLKSLTGSFYVAAAKGGAMYVLQDKLALSSSVSYGLSSAGGFSSVYTNLQMHMVYAITGSMLVKRRELRFQNQVVNITKGRVIPSLLISAGAEQYLLNGTTSVLSASGPGVTLSYVIPFNFLSFTIGAHYSYLIYGNNKRLTLYGFSSGGFLQF